MTEKPDVPPLPRIESDPAVMLGKPVVAGTRITVELLLERLAAGESAEQIGRAFPHLPPGAVPAALAYAASWGAWGRMPQPVTLDL